MNRRGFITGALAAPLVVKSGVLMPVKAVPQYPIIVHTQYLEFGTMPIVNCRCVMDVKISEQIARRQLERLMHVRERVLRGRHG